MAKKQKQEDPPQGSPAWMATFSDLMNLLLCFFVLLFSMSSIDANKFEAILASLTGNFSVFKSGSSMVGNDIYVASGATQMVEIAQYYETREDSGGQDGMKELDNVNDHEAQTEEEEIIEEYQAKIEEEKDQKTEGMYEEIAKKTESEQLGNQVDVVADLENNCVKITIAGAVLFDSGQAELKKEAIPIMSKVGDILKNYKKHIIRIEGHTDNVQPTGDSRYKTNMSLSMARAESVFYYLHDIKKFSAAYLEPSGKGEFSPIADNGTADGRARNRRVEFRIYTEAAE
jgi:chemotaxis protein MotB